MSEAGHTCPLRRSGRTSASAAHQSRKPDKLVSARIANPLPAASVTELTPPTTAAALLRKLAGRGHPGAFIPGSRDRGGPREADHQACHGLLLDEECGVSWAFT